MNAVVGADPGLHGAIAVYDPAINTLSVTDMPRLHVKGKERVDLHALWSVVAGIAEIHAPRIAIIEEVHAMPKQGVVSTFNFGFYAAALQMAFVAACLPIRLVPPAGWKRVMGLNSDKDASRLLASRLLPAHAHHWPLKKHDGRAEAALLAYYVSKLP